MPVTLNASALPGFVVTADTTGVLALQTNATTAMTIDTSQRVGIGTTNPSQRLTVRGGRIVAQANSETYSLQLEYGSGTGQYYIGATNSATPDLVFSNVGGTERMRVTTDGILGVGVIPTASVGNLQISGTAFATSQVYVGQVASTVYSGGIQNLSNTSRSISIEADPTNAGANSLIYFNIDGTTRMAIDSSSNVGIGLTSPNIYSQGASQRYLTVSNTTASAYSYLTLAGGASAGGEVDFGNQTIRHAAIASLDGSALSFYTNGTNTGLTVSERMRVTSAGLVGVAGSLSVGSTTGTLRAFSLFSTEMIMCPAAAAGTNVFFNVSDNAGNNGSNYTLNIRGLGTNGSVQNNLAVVNISALTTNVQTLSKTGGSFKIDHPLPQMTETHHLVHSFVESPDANNIYRGVVDLVAGQATVNLDSVSRMTAGTFVALNRDTQAFVSNQSDWDAVKAKVEGNILTIQCQNSQSTASVSWLVIGMRQDAYMYATDWTNDEGRVIVEPLKPISGET